MNKLYIIFALLLLSACSENPWNSQYDNNDQTLKVLYSAFFERPKHLDPAKSYSSDEWQIINQVYEMPLQYHYLKRPYTLEPLLLRDMPNIKYYDINDKEISETEGNNIKYTTYELNLKDNVKYQPHPAFAKDAAGNYIYIYKNNKFSEIKHFKQTDTRTVTAYDIEYQIKRLADPEVNSPIYGLLVKYLPSLGQLRQQLSSLYDEVKNEPDGFNLILKDMLLDDVEIISNTKLKIKIKGYYPQFIYWLATSFFAPMPWEAIQFYNQPGMIKKNVSLDWYPVGTGPFMVLENNPERHIIMVQNPNFHGERYPSEGEKEDVELLKKAGQDLPFINKIIFSLEKENIPYWSKFLQGYYDSSGISSDNFSYAIDFSPSSGLHLTEKLKNKGISLQTAFVPTSMYWGFNMLDSTVGGYTEKQKKLRRAISIAFSVEEYLNIFANGRGIPAYGPIPPGIVGNLNDNNKFNSYTYKKENNKVVKRSLLEAKLLLKEAGYPNGIDPKTGQPLIIYYDTISTGDPNEKSLLAWMQKQFEKLNIKLIIRATDYNRFQGKVKSGKAQLFLWGWSADYPDPENFFTLFYGPHSSVSTGGENTVNYQNNKFDNLFKKINLISDNKLDLLFQMAEILQEDSPWVWGYHQRSFTLSHAWNFPTKLNPLSRNTFKYRDIDTSLREKSRTNWNKPVYSSLVIMLVIILGAALIFYIEYKKLNSKFVSRY